MPKTAEQTSLYGVHLVTSAAICDVLQKIRRRRRPRGDISRRFPHQSRSDGFARRPIVAGHRGAHAHGAAT